MNYTVIVLAAGQGKRMNAGKNKQFIKLHDKPLIAHTLQVFEQDEWCKHIILVVNPLEIDDMKLLVKQYAITKVHRFIEGGSERQYSVANGLQAVDDEDIVLIHDGARPFVKKNHIHALVVEANDMGAAVLAVRVKDTIKRASAQCVEETLDRSSLWAIQTPQAFRGSIIKRAMVHANKEHFLGTDDASLVEKMGEKVAIIESDYLNIKITTKEDLLFAEAILAHHNQ